MFPHSSQLSHAQRAVCVSGVGFSVTLVKRNLRCLTASFDSLSLPTLPVFSSFFYHPSPSPLVSPLRLALYFAHFPQDYFSPVSRFKHSVSVSHRISISPTLIVRFMFANFSIFLFVVKEHVFIADLSSPWISLF